MTNFEQQNAHQANSARCASYCCIILPLEHIPAKQLFLKAVQHFMTIETHLLCSGHPLIRQIIVSLADLPLQICITQVVTNQVPMS